MVDIDSETLFNGAAAVVATIAVLFFVLNVELGYSPVSKVALVVVFLAGVFALTQRTDDHQLTILGYGVIVVSAVALFFELVSTFDVDDAATVVGLLVIAAVLFWLRTRLDRHNHFLSGQRATYLLWALSALTVVILVTDVVTGGLAYELQPSSEVHVVDSRDRELQVATVVVRNPTPFPERVDTPRYEVCTAGDWSAYRPPAREGEPERRVRARANVNDGYNEHVMSFSSKAYPVRLYIEGANLTGETFPVERTSSCPDTETGAPYLAIYETPERTLHARPV